MLQLSSPCSGAQRRSPSGKLSILLNTDVASHGPRPIGLPTQYSNGESAMLSAIRLSTSFNFQSDRSTLCKQSSLMQGFESIILSETGAAAVRRLSLGIVIRIRRERSSSCYWCFRVARFGVSRSKKRAVGRDLVSRPDYTMGTEQC